MIVPRSLFVFPGPTGTSPIKICLGWAATRLSAQAQLSVEAYQPAEQWALRQRGT